MEQQIRQNRIILGWAYLGLIVFQIGLFGFSFFNKEAYLKIVQIIPLAITVQLIYWMLWIFVIYRICILAKSLNRSRLWWSLGFIFCIGLPPLLLFFLKEAEHPYTLPTSQSSSYMNKTCSNCGRSVSLLSKAGDSCPYCKAYWSMERKFR